MTKKVYIVLTHTRRVNNKKWELVEDIEFVSELRTRHYTTASIIVDYTNSKIISRNRMDISNFAQFESYVWGKYSTQMKQLESKYVVRETPIEITTNREETIVDSFGVSRAKTIFDT